jgi:protein-S-isoprenylcysteine O-methyltransferase Ste14
MTEPHHHQDERGPDVIALPPVLYVGPLIAGLVLDRLLPLPRLPRRLRLAGVPLVAGGLGLGAWFVTAMTRARTPIDVYHAPKALVESGPFARTRNPAYLSMAVIYAGVALVAGGRWPFVLLPGVLLTVDRGVIQREEAYLDQRFGSDYRNYRGRVRRWL